MLEIKKVIVLLLMLTVGLFGCKSAEEAKEGDVDKPNEEKLLQVGVTEVGKEVVRERLRLVGRVEGEVELDLYADVGVVGIVRNIKAVEGSYVKRGQYIMELDQKAVTGRDFRRFVLRAKMSGYISRVYVEEGELVNGQRKLCRIIRVKRVKVYIDIPEKDIWKVGEGQKVLINPKGYNGAAVEGKISRLYPALDPSTLTLRTEVIVENKGLKLKSGMFTQVSILLEEKEAYTVPLKGVLMEDNIAYVYLYDAGEGVVNRQDVILGQYYEEKVEILKGLKTGDKVVVNGNYHAYDGEKVKLWEGAKRK